MKKKLLLIVSLFVTSTLFAQLTQESVKLYMPFDGDVSVTPSSVTVEKSALVASGAYDISYTDGIFGQAGVFDSIAFVTNGLDFNPQSAFTITCWYYVVETASEKGEQHTLMHQYDDPDGAAGRIFIEMLGSDNFGSFVSGIRNDDTDVVTSGAWYHLGVVRDDAGMLHLYVNGEEKSTAEDAKLESNNEEVVIGGRKQENNKFLAKGYFDDLLIAQISTSKDDIVNIMNSGVDAVLNGTGSAQLIDIEDVTISKISSREFRVNNINSVNAPYSIYDTAGRMIKAGSLKNDKSFTLDNTKRGIYFIRIAAENNYVTKKIVVQ